MSLDTGVYFGTLKNMEQFCATLGEYSSIVTKNGRKLDAKASNYKMDIYGQSNLIKEIINGDGRNPDHYIKEQTMKKSKQQNKGK